MVKGRRFSGSDPRQLRVNGSKAVRIDQNSFISILLEPPIPMKIEIIERKGKPFAIVPLREFETQARC
jgi:hypothetical protein